MANQISKPAVDPAALATAETPSAVTIAITKVLDAAGQKQTGTEFWHSAMRLANREQVLELARQYVEVQQ
jgi:hypothetical protein